MTTTGAALGSLDGFAEGRADALGRNTGFGTGSGDGGSSAVGAARSGEGALDGGGAEFAVDALVEALASGFVGCATSGPARQSATSTSPKRRGGMGNTNDDSRLDNSASKEL